MGDEVDTVLLGVRQHFVGLLAFATVALFALVPLAALALALSLGVSSLPQLR